MAYFRTLDGERVPMKDACQPNDVAVQGSSRVVLEIAYTDEFSHTTEVESVYLRDLMVVLEPGDRLEIVEVGPGNEAGRHMALIAHGAQGSDIRISQIGGIHESMSLVKFNLDAACAGRPEDEIGVSGAWIEQAVDLPSVGLFYQPPATPRVTPS